MKEWAPRSLPEQTASTTLALRSSSIMYYNIFNVFNQQLKHLHVAQHPLPSSQLSTLLCINHTTLMAAPMDLCMCLPSTFRRKTNWWPYRNPRNGNPSDSMKARTMYAAIVCPTVRTLPSQHCKCHRLQGPRPHARLTISKSMSVYTGMLKPGKVWHRDCAQACGLSTYWR